MTGLKPILCPNCGHDIDVHHDDEDAQNVACFEPVLVQFSYGVEEMNCDCDLRPSDIARALLTAEPTDAQVDAVIDLTWHDPKWREAWSVDVIRSTYRQTLAADAKVRAGQ